MTRGTLARQVAVSLLASAVAVAAIIRGKQLLSEKKRRTSPLSSSSRHAKEAKVAVDLALRCGAAMRQCFQKKVLWKDASSIDPVTATDRDNEKLVVEGLKSAFPSHQVIGEEAAAALGSTPKLTDAPTWIVDPIDGTTNFVYGIKLSCVSLGLCIGRRPVVGVVYDPYADELFVAAEGEGAYLNGQRIQVDDATKLAQAMVLFELGYERSEEGVAKMLGGLRSLMLGGVRATRTIGTAVLSLCWVACGRASAYYTGMSGEGGKPWDYAAGTVIALEAGASFCNLQGAPFDVEGRTTHLWQSPILVQRIKSRR
ncbi:IMP1 [Symbiodinium sp. CCMP2456]|nr:IMP1 [Symbiodinium sp. CCMP2456]